MCRLSFLLIVLGLASAVAQESGSVPEKTIVIGIRAEARPFAWYDKTSDTFRGYLTDLCYDAVRNANYLPQGVAITATERASFLRGDPSFPASAPDGIDLLCDPTTISMRRITHFLNNDDPPRRRFSPIVFLANGTFSMRPDINAENLRERNADLSGWTCTGEDTSDPVTLLVGFVIGTTAESEVLDLHRNPTRILSSGEGPVWNRICSREFDNHPEGVSKLCDGEIDLYFGDNDIVNAYADRVTDCKPVPRAKLTSYEPYAFVVTDKTEGFYDHFVKGLYASFGNTDKAQNRVRTYFPQHEISRYLETLYRIYQIP